MLKFIQKVSGAMKAVKMVAALADCVSAACSAWTEKWHQHFPEDNKEAA